MINEFGRRTKYVFDSTWGGVKSVSTYNEDEDVWELVYADEYDTDMCALMQRTFGSSVGRSNTCIYTGGNLSTLQTNNLKYGFTQTAEEQDAIGTIIKNTVTRMDVPIEEHHHTTSQTDSYYPSQASKLHSSSAVFDKYGRLVAIDGVLTNVYDVDPSYNTPTGGLLTTANNASALLAMATDEMRSETARFMYNDKGLLSNKLVTDKLDYSNLVQGEVFGYDAVDRMIRHVSTFNSANSKTITETVDYQKDANRVDADRKVDKYTYAVSDSCTALTQNVFGDYGRLEQKIHTFGGSAFTRTLGYNSTRVDSEAYSHGGTTTYTYDHMGRISETLSGGKTTTYYYDQYSQLIRENNETLAKTFIYEYNGIGNLLSVTQYDYTASNATPAGTPVTTTFGYTDDRLTSFGGATIGYNAMGCPTTYEGKTATWSKGKLSKLSSGTRTTGISNYNYSYNAFGQRVSKTYSHLAGTNTAVQIGQLTAANKTYYYDHAGRLISEAGSKTYYGADTTSENIVFLYDESSIIGMVHTVGTTANTYYFQRNLQGDVVAIYDANGVLKAKYLYDAWGNCTISSETTSYDVANANPIRYRGYYYDDDTGLYYCNARYYSPKWRRFISPVDAQSLSSASVNGLNMYVYSGNNPVGIIEGNPLMYTSGVSRLSPVKNAGAKPNISAHISSSSMGFPFMWPKTNAVTMSHGTLFTLVQDPVSAWIWGNFSVSVTVQHNPAEMFYQFTDVDVIDGATTKWGLGMNINDWFGLSAYYTNSVGFGIGWQITPWTTNGIEWSMSEGLSFSRGLIFDNVTFEISVSIGNGILGLALCAYALSAAPIAFIWALPELLPKMFAR